ncbi:MULTISPECIES: nuclear transport factor 2 family protein [Amycolatopsis]|uniref:Nuclear transport factor 2 family protein n=1 Tax=Amycolatopsis albidoflavus TaxID=102226 RepID=A0ABW5I955_9PSEU
MTPSTRTVVGELFARLAKADLDGLDGLFAEEVDWHIPGAAGLVPWLGRRRTPAEVADFFASVSRYVIQELFEVDRIFVDGEESVVTGRLRSVVRATGRPVESQFAIRITVVGGRIKRYLFLEDSYAVANAVRP